ncbi:GNAT family N-acetyltransferase [Kitasatospora sp. McL0602]|uniref:GNAT family N-acetyltransferase n=1 Tax=Kitasatospora sp. McL0602 TaxID=3439530 RepID=UPI003F8AE406
MEYEIEGLAAEDIDRAEPLWAQLLAHHVRAAPQLAALGAVRTAEESWRIRRAQYVEWLADPLTLALLARGPAGPLGYAVVRVVEAPGSWEWGDRAGVLETLTVDETARGGGVGQALLDAARAHVAGQGLTAMRVSVVAGNVGALRFYRRAGAVDFVRVLVLPVGPRP